MSGSKKVTAVRPSDVQHELKTLRGLRYEGKRVEIQIEWKAERGQKRGEISWHGLDKVDAVPNTKRFNQHNYNLLKALVRQLVSDGTKIDSRIAEELRKTYRIVLGSATAASKKSAAEKKSGRSRAGSDKSEGSITRELREEEEEKQREELKKKKAASKKKATTVAPAHGKNNQSEMVGKKDKLVDFIDKSITGSDPLAKHANKQVADGKANKPLPKDAPSRMSKTKKEDTAAAKAAIKKEKEDKKKAAEMKEKKEKEVEASKKKKKADEQKAKKNEKMDTAIFFGVRKMPSRDVSAKTKKGGKTKDDDSNLKKKKK